MSEQIRMRFDVFIQLSPLWYLRMSASAHAATWLFELPAATWLQLFELPAATLIKACALDAHGNASGGSSGGFAA